eukprot:CAMPEP_0181234098 /NCGR_PEP_ID=MMETSP1096-20121128/36748_1 /TAXON_ID=156174 ORGANISM="Chrysochromulina ericina, Strain CCMP281" /NCGR_SAMPLE_ID=MMETSP1096 /ASSEMBLY_ACC=CAM_ASM_000453 /LENGTH=42 /DNA_ID= /DNA_START= /DNA_END= /DNA_ORIENTATION=
MGAPYNDADEPSAGAPEPRVSETTGTDERGSSVPSSPSRLDA